MKLLKQEPKKKDENKFKYLKEGFYKKIYKNFLLNYFSEC